MKILLLPAVLVLLVGCSRPSPQPDALGEWKPEIGLVESIYQVLDKKSRERVGFVDKTSYDSGRLIYWVYGPDRKEKLGYVLPNNSAYRFVWHAGYRDPEAQSIGADKMSFNVRRILDYDKVVDLEPIDQEELADEMLAGRYGKKEEGAEPASTEEG
jgi:hypothetical protein